MCKICAYKNEIQIEIKREILTKICYERFMIKLKVIDSALQNSLSRLNRAYFILLYLHYK